ncbi:Rha family transcriptional regulator [Candidatus Magnetobacterium casense]|uniref:Rha family transcriptional regulator n=1 Tax=Candidatus Magnetobacterium casense TaxID=1455061 RepID=UPI0005904405|nr:Rha family transcriptional regulator [Candidatus Magnetobacterium casensis]
MTNPVEKKQAEVSNNEIVIYEKNGQLFTTSREVADKFGKRHAHVLEAIKGLEIPEDFREPNFRLSSEPLAKLLN